MKKEKRRVYDEVELLEVSPVGIPSYPEAINRSLIKSIRTKMPEEKQDVSENEEKGKEKEETEKAEKANKAEKAEDTEDSEESGSDSAKAMASAFRELAKELKADRKALVEKQDEEKEPEKEEKSIDEMSAGEVAIKCGLFRTDVKTLTI